MKLLKRAEAADLALVLYCALNRDKEMRRVVLFVGREKHAGKTVIQRAACACVAADWVIVLPPL